MAVRALRLVEPPEMHVPVALSVLPARFRAKINVAATPDGCWIWTGAHDRSGYGWVRLDKRPWRAHRLAYTLVIGTIPSGLTLDHLCKTPPCVNPAHLEPVTQRENVLRGDGPSASHARQTHCIRGHSLSGSNLVLSQLHRRRRCRLCQKLLEGRRRRVRATA